MTEPSKTMPDLTAPGTRFPGSPAGQSRQQAIEVARRVLRVNSYGVSESPMASEVQNLAREFLRAIGLPEGS